MPHRYHFITKLTETGGPQPHVELARIIQQAAESENRTAWFATRKPGSEWRRADDGTPSVALVFAINDDNSIDAVVVEVLERRTEIPDDPVTRDLYRDYKGFKAWWLLVDPVAVRLPSLQIVPGTSTAGKSASDAFVGNLSFAYWSFGPLDQVVEHLRVADEPAVSAATSPRARRPGRILREPVESMPSSSLYGVDFSGGQEMAARGNPKIWVASWDVERGTIDLRRGTDEPPLRRLDLPALVSQSPGWWVFDFPFGVARETAAALGIDGNSWDGWLEWCARGGDATERRDAARAAVERSGTPWSARRAVDREHGTTWFPLFEQLYKQTIYGARDVLAGLATAVPNIALLPWHDPDGARTVVIEGFPGVTIRTHLGLKGIGYKGRQAHHCEERQKILEAVAAALPVPVSEAVARVAIEDHEGDALDALVLLLAGWAAQQYPGWKACRATLTSDQRLVEGWFPA